MVRVELINNGTRASEFGSIALGDAVISGGPIERSGLDANEHKRRTCRDPESKPPSRMPTSLTSGSAIFVTAITAESPRVAMLNSFSERYKSTQQVHSPSGRPQGSAKSLGDTFPPFLTHTSHSWVPLRVRGFSSLELRIEAHPSAPAFLRINNTSKNTPFAPTTCAVGSTKFGESKDLSQLNQLSSTSWVGDMGGEDRRYCGRLHEKGRGTERQDSQICACSEGKIAQVNAGPYSDGFRRRVPASTTSESRLNR
ncbi:hypothetical protein DFP72DRAFT_1097061 [Ephemerocybe angulata]|uniref:Uncharacterized protein n=1 Tax=Ephemerocybe angulata TaxID=980116 RepID=A0A8H6IA07_9AGAR|nr:hypothetical protein DFP72DRAFT_1097061 [Tulosesus angulatus]